MGKRVFQSKDSEELDAFFQKIQQIFSEYVGRPSELDIHLHEKRREVLHVYLNIEKNKPWKIGLAKIVKVGATGIFLLVGMMIWRIFFLGIQRVGRWSGIFLSRNERIKRTLIVLDRHLDATNAEYKFFSRCMEHFFSGENINLVAGVEKHIQKFYSHLQKADGKKKQLIQSVQDSEFHDFFDISITENYIDTQLTKPLLDMLHLLEKTEQKITLYLKKIQKQYTTTEEPSLK